MSVEMLIRDLKSKQVQLEENIKDIEYHNEKIKDIAKDIYYLIQNIEFEHQDEIADARKRTR